MTAASFKEELLCVVQQGQVSQRLLQNKHLHTGLMVKTLSPLIQEFSLFFLAWGVQCFTGKHKGKTAMCSE